MLFDPFPVSVLAKSNYTDLSAREGGREGEIIALSVSRGGVREDRQSSLTGQCYRAAEGTYAAGQFKEKCTKFLRTGTQRCHIDLAVFRKSAIDVESIVTSLALLAIKL